MLYFAYGSNLLTPRLLTRAPSAQVYGTAILRGHALHFHKRARDGSAKCDALPTSNALDVVHGALFEIAAADWESLDRAEGRGNGYEREVVEVEPVDSRTYGDPRPVSVQIYRAQAAYVDEALLPYSWYLDLVVAGARLHALPPSYIDRLARQAVTRDPDAAREAREREFLCR